MASQVLKSQVTQPAGCTIRVSVGYRLTWISKLVWHWNKWKSTHLKSCLFFVYLCVKCVADFSHSTMAENGRNRKGTQKREKTSGELIFVSCFRLFLCHTFGIRVILYPILTLIMHPASWVINCVEICCFALKIKSTTHSYIWDSSSRPVVIW